MGTVVDAENKDNPDQSIESKRLALAQQTASYGLEMLNEQGLRSRSVAVFIQEGKINLWLYTRSAIVKNTEVQFLDNNAGSLVSVIFAMGRMDLKDWGWSPHITFCPRFNLPPPTPRPSAITKPAPAHCD